MLSPVVFDQDEQLALARYIDRHGIQYGRDADLLEQIRNKLPAEPPAAPLTVDPR